VIQNKTKRAKNKIVKRTGRGKQVFSHIKNVFLTFYYLFVYLFFYILSIMPKYSRERKALNFAQIDYHIGIEFKEKL
jgi:hypothetical protein